MRKKYTVNTQKAISETLDGETIIINLENGNYYSMNESGSQIWNAILAGQDIDTEAPDIASFLESLEREDLIIATGEPVDGAPTALVLTEKPQFEKYDDMQQMLLADPIHDVDTAGWPKLKDAS